MTPFSYRLIVLTHGPDFSYLERTVGAFFEHAWPYPQDVLLVVDGPSQPPAEILEGHPRLSLGEEQVGNCRATAACWQQAATSAHPYVFHLEHDFALTRTLNVAALAHVLERNIHLAQMALIRQPVGREVEHGGFIGEAPGWYTHRVDDGLEWYETSRNFTLNPTLIRRDLPRRYPWPAQAQCETTYGHRMLQHAPYMRFGLWGNGEPWCEHFGIHDGIGY